MKKEEITIDGELSCNNCLEKTRCKQQQEVKVKRIDTILSYIANEDNEKYIAELKNEIPAITRCDVVLEKQLKRLKQENEQLRNIQEIIKKLPDYYNSLDWEAKGHRAITMIEEIRQIIVNRKESENN